MKHLIWETYVPHNIVARSDLYSSQTTWLIYASGRIMLPTHHIFTLYVHCLSC